MTNDEQRCEICDREECTRKVGEDRYSGFQINVEAGHIKAPPSMLDGTLNLLREVADKARRDCEQHAVDWRALAQELREKEQRVHPNSIVSYYDRFKKERLELRQKLVQAGYDHPDHAFVETFDRALKDNKNLHFMNQRDCIDRLESERDEARVALDNAGQRDRHLSMAESIGRLADKLIHAEAEVKRLQGVIQKLSADDVPAKVEHAQNYDKLAKEHGELQVRHNALLAEHNDARTMRDVYKARCEKLQAHNQRPVEWKRTVADSERLAWLYCHDMALPSSTESEKALGAAVLYLVELVQSGRDVVDTILSRYEVHNLVGGRASGLEGWARGWLARATATESIVVPAPPPAPPLPGDWNAG